MIVLSVINQLKNSLVKESLDPFKRIEILKFISIVLSIPLAGTIIDKAIIPWLQVIGSPEFLLLLQQHIIGIVLLILAAFILVYMPGWYYPSKKQYN